MGEEGLLGSSQVLERLATESSSALLGQVEKPIENWLFGWGGS